MSRSAYTLTIALLLVAAFGVFVVAIVLSDPMDPSPQGQGVAFATCGVLLIGAGVTWFLKMRALVLGSEDNGHGTKGMH